MGSTGWNWAAAGAARLESAAARSRTWLLAHVSLADLHLCLSAFPMIFSCKREHESVSVTGRSVAISGDEPWYQIGMNKG
jgi:hypothetical protein